MIEKEAFYVMHADAKKTAETLSAFRYIMLRIMMIINAREHDDILDAIEDLEEECKNLHADGFYNDAQFNTIKEICNFAIFYLADEDKEEFHNFQRFLIKIYNTE